MCECVCVCVIEHEAEKRGATKRTEEGDGVRRGSE